MNTYDLRSKMSLAIIFRNEELNLQNLLAELRADYHNSFNEIILVDNVSTDNSVNVIKSFRFENTKIIVLKNNQNNLASARNLALAHSNSEWTYFIDCDCRLIKENFQTLCQFVNNCDPSYLVLAGGNNLINTNSSFMMKYINAFELHKFAHLNSIQFKSPILLKPILFVSTCNLLIKTKIYKNDVFNKNFISCGEDLSFSLNMSNLGIKIWSIPGIDVNHLQNISFFHWCKKMLKYGEAQVLTMFYYPNYLLSKKGAIVALFYGSMIFLSKCTLIYSLFLGIYFLILVGTFNKTISSKDRFFYSVFILLSQIFYGLGLIFGLKIFIERRIKIPNLLKK